MSERPEETLPSEVWGITHAEKSKYITINPGDALDQVSTTWKRREATYERRSVIHG